MRNTTGISVESIRSCAGVGDSENLDLAYARDRIDIGIQRGKRIRQSQNESPVRIGRPHTGIAYDCSRIVDSEQLDKRGRVRSSIWIIDDSEVERCCLAVPENSMAHAAAGSEI
jgi:hypothetical protein